MKLKRFVALVVSLAMVLSVVPAFSLTASAESIGDIITVGGIDYEVIGENLVTNGTFETSTEGWNRWDGSNVAALGSFSRSTAQAHSGDYSLKCDENGGGNSNGNLLGQFDLGDGVQAGDKYVVSFWSYSNNTDMTLTVGLGNATNQVDIDCGGLGNSDADPISCNIKGLPTNQWRQHIYVLTAKADSAFAEIYARWLGTGTYFDDVELYKVEQVYDNYAIGDEVENGDVTYQVASNNLVTNGSFEDADGNFDMTGWIIQKDDTNFPNAVTETKNYYHAAYEYGYYYAATEYNLGATHNNGHTGPRIGNPTDGSWYIMTQWEDGFGGLCSIKRSFALETGKTYLFMYDIKSNSGTKSSVDVYVDSTLAAATGTQPGEVTEDWKTVSYYVTADDTNNTLWFNEYASRGTCFDNFRLYELEVPQTVVDVTVTYTAGGETVKTETKSYDSAVTQGASFDAYTYYADGGNYIYSAAAEVVSESKTIVMTQLANADVNGYANGGTYATAAESYNIVSGNLIPNGNFGNGLTGWLNGSGAVATEFTVNGDGTVTSKADGGNGTANCLYRSWAIEDGATYLYTFTTSSTNAYQMFTLSNSLGTDEERMVVGDGDSVNTGKYSELGNPKVGTNSYVFTNTEGYDYAKIRFRWNVTNTFGNFGLYKLEEDASQKAATTIKFVDSSDNTTEIADAVTVAGILGSTIDLTAYAHESITYNDKIYAKDDTNDTSYTVTGQNDIVKITYTVDAFTSFTAPAVTVIEGNDPILPATVTGITEKGVTTEISGAVWTDYTDLPAGTHTVNGTVTVDGETVNGSVTVTVLEESFALANADSINGGAGNVLYFPMEITDEFTAEFDYTINQIKDVSVQMGYNGNTYSAAALGISPNGNQLKATGGDKAGTGEGIVLIDPVNVGETYRMLLTMDASSDTYTLTVTKPDGTTVTTGEKGFRQAQDAINTMTLRTNGGGADGDITVSNIKVHSATIKKATVTLEYTTSDGTVVGTYTHEGYTGDNVVFPVGIYTAADGTRYEVEAKDVTITETAHTVTVNAVKQEEVTVNYIYNEEILKTKTFYAAAGTEVSYHAFTIATEDAVYSAPAFTATVDTVSRTHTVIAIPMESTVKATDTLTYNATTGATMPYPTDRGTALAGKEDAMLSVSWNDDRYGEMVFDVKTGENEAIATATLILTPGDIMVGRANTFNVYAVPVSSYGTKVDYSTLTPVGSGTFGAVDVPVEVALDLSGFDASEGVMLIYKMVDGLVGVYGKSFTEAPVLKYNIREKATATFTYVCEGTTVGAVTREGYVGDTVSVELGYYEAEDGTKYYVDAASVVLVSGENTAEVNARKIETVTINYTLDGATKKTVVLEGFAGDAVIAPAVYVNDDKAVYWATSNEYTLIAGGITEQVELSLVEGATFASTTDTFNVTQNTAMVYPEGADRYAPFFNTDAFLSASWGDNRYGEMLFDVTVPEGDIINSAQLTLIPGDIMVGFTNSFDIYAADPATFSTTANDLSTLTVVGSGRFTGVNEPVTVDLDLTKYDNYTEDDKVLLLYKVTSGLVGVYGASFGDNAPRLSYTTGELGARVDVSDEFVVEYAKGTLSDFNSLNPPVPTTGYLEAADAWEGFDETGVEGVSHIDIYAESVNEPIIRVVSELTAGATEFDELEPSTVTTPGYGAESEYVLFSFNPEIGTANWTDIGLRDNDGKLITAFRINNDTTDTLCPYWGHVGWATPFRSEFATMEYSFNPAGEAKATITDLVSQVDVLMRNFDPDSEVEGDEYYTVAFIVDGNVVTVGKYTGSFNGLKDIQMAASGSTTNQYGGIAAVKIYSGKEPRVIGSITANYIYKDEVVHTVTKYYDKHALAEGETASLEFPEFYYSGLGEYLLYRVPAETLTENKDIQVVQYHPTTNAVTTLIHNWSHDELTPGDLYTNSETAKTYSIATRNLIANGNFEYGVEAWYDGELGPLSEVEFVTNPDNETVIIRANGTTVSEYGFYNAWALEKGATYLFTYTATGLSDTYAGITQTDEITPVSYDPTLATKLVDGKNYVVFDAESDYLKLNIGWSKNAEVGSFGLYKLDIIEMSDIYRTIIEGSDPVLPKYVSTYEEGIVDRVVWRAEDLEDLQIGENTVTGDLYYEVVTSDEATEDATGEATEEDEEYIVDEDGTVLVPVGETVTATVMVYPESFTHDTINSYNGQSDLTSKNGNQKLERAITGKFVVEMDVTIENYGDMWIILNDSEKTNDTSFFGADQILVSPSYFGGEIMPQNGHGDGNRDETQTLMIAGRNKPYRYLIMGDTNSDTYSVTVITPEGISKTFEDHGFRTNTDKIDSVAMFTNSDGTGTFTAENIKVYDLDPIDVNYVLQKNGEEDRALTTEELGEYFYGEEITLPEGKFYLSYYDENLPAYETEEPAEDPTGESAEGAEPNDNVAHIVKTTEEQTFVVKAEHSETPHTVYVQMHKENAVLYDTFATGTEAELDTAENLLFVGSNAVSEAPKYDDDGEATVTAGGPLGAPRVPILTFNIPEFYEGDVVMLNLYAYQANQNLGVGNSMKLATGVISDVEVDESTVYAPDSIASLENIIWSDAAITQNADNDGAGRHTVTGNRVAIDVTDLVIKAQEAGKDRITFAVYAPTAGAYIMDRESTRYGAIHQGDFAAFLEVENDTYTLTVNGASKVTKNGSAVQLVDGSTTTVYIRNEGTVARMYTEAADHVAFVESTTPKIHNIATETTSENTTVRRATVEAATMVEDGVYYPVKLGADMVNGAQVRIGGGVDENGEFVGGSGLRFITVVDQNETLAAIALDNEDMEIGVKVTAEDSDKVVYIPAEMWQTEGSVFTSALTNLAVSNYNRNFTAVPYIKCTDADGEAQEYTNAPVKRSIYQVAAGLLAKGYNTEDDSNGVITDGKYDDDMGGETDYSEMPAKLIDVLNAYVNKVGVRLTLSDNSETATLTARMTGSGAYTGEAFFTVGETEYADGKYTVTLTAEGESKIDTALFNTYVRINNNNKKVSPVTEITDNGDGTYTLVFDYSAMN